MVKERSIPDAVGPSVVHLSLRSETVVLSEESADATPEIRRNEPWPRSA
jgi:hypothetical protein